MSEDFFFEEIPDSEAEFSQRGRKSTAPPELVKALTTLKVGKTLRLSSFVVKPTDKKAKTDKARISAVIRSAGKVAGLKVSISWTSLGVPQVRISPTK